jgi:branched-chain amino acid transport system substrate-binding protein
VSEERISRKSFIGGAAATGLTLALGSRFAPLAQGAPLKEKTASYLAKAKTIVIGLPVEHDFPDHLDMLNGTQLAIEEINAHGGVLGRKLALNSVDFNTFDAQSTQLAFQKLIGGKPAALACAYAEEVVQAANVAAAYGCPYINGDASEAGNAMVASNPTKYRNRFSCPSDTYYGTAFPSFLAAAKARGWKPTGNTVHIVETAVTYSQVISASAKAALAGSGNWNVVATSQVPFPTVDWSSAIAALHSTNPAVILISHFDPGMEAAFAKQFAANPVKGALVYLQYGASQGSFLDLAGPAANGMCWSTFYAVPPTAKGKAFLAKYKKRFNNPKYIGYTYTAYGYDTAYIFAKAWKAVGDPMNFKAVNRYIKTHTFPGIAGDWNFGTPQNGYLMYPDEVSQPKFIPHIFFQIQNLQQRAITPARFADAHYMAPPWA